MSTWRDELFVVGLAFCAGVIIMGLASGCTLNRYKLTSIYTSPEDSLTITSEVEGKATIGKVAHIYRQNLDFLNAQYRKK